MTSAHSLLVDLYRHQAWADDLHLNAVAAHAPSAADEVIRTRMAHIYAVQLFFRWMVEGKGGTFTPLDPASVTDLEKLAEHVRQYHAEMVPFVESLEDARLAETVENPFAPPGPTMTVAQALVQCAMHSHYHRGQNATRIRELGGEPTLTDFIAWIWFGGQNAKH